ncbi:MAG: hypothetical protein HZA93_27535 [Verrucomicrobia bacterium]|nr:hypothetical protein [Verrucomicrobiota bacterium]
MKNYLVGIAAGLCAVSFAIAGESSPAHPAVVTLTVVQFRALDGLAGGTPYTDATTTLAAHPLVTAVGDEINPTLRCRGAVEFEIRVASADKAESYTPVGIYFRQQAGGDDANGAANFAPAERHGATLRVKNRFATRGARWELFVVIRRNSDGAIGVIDPPIENDQAE